jgi:hypothetical protein
MNYCKKTQKLKFCTPITFAIIKLPATLLLVEDISNQVAAAFEF